jgi:hypothetical protein
MIKAEDINKFMIDQRQIDLAIADHERRFSRYGWVAVGLLFVHDILIIIAIKFII